MVKSSGVGAHPIIRVSLEFLHGLSTSAFEFQMKSDGDACLYSDHDISPVRFVIRIIKIGCSRDE